MTQFGKKGLNSLEITTCHIHTIITCHKHVNNKYRTVCPKSPSVNRLWTTLLTHVCDDTCSRVVLKHVFPTIIFLFDASIVKQQEEKDKRYVFFFSREFLERNMKTRRITVKLDEIRASDEPDFTPFRS